MKPRELIYIYQNQSINIYHGPTTQLNTAQLNTIKIKHKKEGSKADNLLRSRRRCRSRRRRCGKIIADLLSNPQRLGAVVYDRFFEPGVFEGLFCGDAQFWVVDEDAAEEVEEVFVEGCCGGDEVLGGGSC